ncbi:hypothetical protein ACFVJS_03800 [Nocardioides sp. NPDC057772]|uniref:hypothetical protein n=1 Tax=Nocardioides sp. NPDC057772 TaxID=3346245 RepID=UPI00366BADFC
MSEQTTQPDQASTEPQIEPRHVLVRIDYGDVVVIQPIGRREAETRRLKVLDESAYLPSGRLKPVERIPVEKPSEGVETAETGDQGEDQGDAQSAAQVDAETAAQAAPAPKGKAPKTSAATAAKKTDATPAPGSTTPEEK